MALEAISESPVVEDFTLLPDHQEQTPGSFFGGKPVLHLHSPGAKIKISQNDLSSQPELANLQQNLATTEGSESGEQIEVEGIDVWVSSSYLTLFSSTKATGVQIPYQTITVHAQEGNAVFLGLNLSDSNTADEDIVFIQLRIIPTTIEHHTPLSETDQGQQTNGDTTTSNPSQALFKAISDCQELNPDPPEEGDEDFDETAPGATGWITSENMQDFMDENGEFRIPQGAAVYGEEDGEVAGGLGDGAGRTRTATEVDAEDCAEDETKWQRTS